MNDDSDKSVTISPRQGFLPLGLFRNTYIEEYNYPTLFFSHLRPHISCSYQKMTQVELSNVKRKIAYHITNVLLNNKIFNSFYIIFCMHSYMERKINGTYAHIN